MLLLNGWMSVLAALGLTFVVLHPRIHEGLGIKFGLITMIFSLWASAAIAFNDLPIAAAFNAGLSLRAGIVIVCAGYWFKYRKARRDGGPTDFGSLTEMR